MSNATTVAARLAASTSKTPLQPLQPLRQLLQPITMPDRVRTEYTAVSKRISECVQRGEIETLWSMVCAYRQIYGGDHGIGDSAECDSTSRTQFYAAAMHQRVTMCTMLADVASRRDSVDVVVRRTIPESGTALAQLLMALQ